MTVGSLQNLMLTGAASKTPEVGDGVTFISWTDRDAGTVVEVSKSGKRIGVQKDNAERVDTNGMSENQTYKFTPNPEAEVLYYSLRKDGKWKMVGSTFIQLRVGSRDKYYDFSF